MPRQARLDATGTLHHVMIRGIESANIFRDDKDREHFLSRGGKIGKTRLPVISEAGEVEARLLE